MNKVHNEIRASGHGTAACALNPFYQHHCCVAYGLGQGIASDMSGCARFLCDVRPQTMGLPLMRGVSQSVINQISATVRGVIRPEGTSLAARTRRVPCLRHQRVEHRTQKAQRQRFQRILS